MENLNQPEETGIQFRNCGSDELQVSMAAVDPSYVSNIEAIEIFTNDFITNNPTYDPTSIPTIVIPVVFHVVYNTTVQNISDSKLLAQIDQLNLDFSATNPDGDNTPPLFQPIGNMNIQFCLAKRDPNGYPTTGILRRQTTVTSFPNSSAIKYYSSGGSDAWPRDSYLNIWVCEIQGGILGFAPYPGGNPSTDGIVLDYETVGSYSNPGSLGNYDKGRTAAHEVGHWLNLKHIWGGSTCGDDGVSDTPVHDGPNYGCPTYPHYSTCAGSPVSMTMNFMDYTADECMYMFSPGQVLRVHALFQPGGARYPLLSSLGCQVSLLPPTPTITATPPTTPGPTPTFTPPVTPTPTGGGGGGGTQPPPGNTLLVVYSQCGIVNANDNGIINGRNSFEFTLSLPNGQNVTAVIQWNDSILWWECIEKSTNTVISILDKDIPYPIGGVSEWQDVAAFSCLGSVNWFSTLYGSSPPVYFKLCDDNSGSPSSFFGIQNFSSTVTSTSSSGITPVQFVNQVGVAIPGEVYYLEMRQFTGCCEVYGAAIPPTSIIYDGSINLFYSELFNDCVSCTASTVTSVVQGCEPPLPTPTPATTVNECGTSNLLGNECEPIVLYRMGVTCSTTSSQSQAGDGTATLTITGGTPPYLTTWSNGQSGPSLTQLIPGEYTATTTDYYYDFTAITVCVVSSPQLNAFALMTSSSLPEQPKLCFSITVDGTPTQYQFNDGQRLINGKPTWVDNSGNYSIYWVKDNKQSYWFLQGFYDESYKILNYSPKSPPTTGWGAVGSTFSNITTRVFEGLCYSGDVCASFDNPSECGEDTFDLTYNGEVNGQSSWIGQLPCGVVGDDWLLYFNTGATRWETSGVTGSTGFLDEATHDPISPFGNYTISGSSYELTISSGSCTYNPSLIITLSQNNPTQESNGSILCNVTGGIPPYQYSIDNGTTFKSFPIFSGLKGGTYVVVAKDVSGSTVNGTIILTEPPKVSVYNIYLTTTQSIVSQTTTTLTKKYNTVVNVSPSLPSGTTIVFDILHTNTFETSPVQTASTITTNSILKINSVPQSITSTASTQTTGTNLTAGCQNKLKYITASTQNWNTVYITSSDLINIETTTSTVKNISDYCYISNSSEKYVLSNATISGCNYCQVVIT